MGVWPRGAQVRQRCGRWLSPLSSINTRMRPSFSAFFWPGPHLLLPVANLLFIALPGSPLRSLRTPAQTHENLPDMALVIAHLKFLLDQIGHPGTGPQWSLIAYPLGTCDQ